MSKRVVELLTSLESIDKQPEAHITISGPVQCGKSIIMDRIVKMLKSEFPNIQIEMTSPEEYDQLEDWERDMVLKTKWITNEISVAGMEKSMTEMKFKLSNEGFFDLFKRKKTPFKEPNEQEELKRIYRTLWTKYIDQYWQRAQVYHEEDISVGTASAIIGINGKLPGDINAALDMLRSEHNKLYPAYQREIETRYGKSMKLINVVKQKSFDKHSVSEFDKEIELLSSPFIVRQKIKTGGIDFGKYEINNQINPKNIIQPINDTNLKGLDKEGVDLCARIMVGCYYDIEREFETASNRWTAIFGGDSHLDVLNELPSNSEWRKVVHLVNDLVNPGYTIFHNYNVHLIFSLEKLILASVK